MDVEQTLRVGNALADRSRLSILVLLRGGPRCVEEIARALDLADSTVSFHLKKLSAAGLVTSRRDQYYTMYELLPRSMECTIADLITFDDEEEEIRQARSDRERAKIVSTFFNEGGLVRMPVQKRKRDMVLEEFAALFAPGAEYAESEVDSVIHTLAEDHCLVRRLLVDEGYMQRAAGVYKRSDRPVGPSRRPASQETGAPSASRHTGDLGDEQMTQGGTRVDQGRRAELRRC